MHKDCLEQSMPSQLNIFSKMCLSDTCLYWILVLAYYMPAQATASEADVPNTKSGNSGYLIKIET